MKFLIITNDKEGLQKFLLFAKMFPDWSVVEAIEKACIQ